MATNASPVTPRTLYLNGDISFREFYAPIARALGAQIPESIMAKVRTCKETSIFRGDDSLTLNEIPLPVWDALGCRYIGSARAAFQAAGDFYSLAGMVCALKTQALIQLEGEKAQEVSK